MTKKQKYFQKRKLSFKYAFNGIWQVVKHEANFRIHIVAALLVILMGFLCHISKTEWMIAILTIGCVMSAEIFNSTIEKFIDLIHPQQDKNAGLIKDISAAAVLILAIAASIIGFIIFIPKIIECL